MSKAISVLRVLALFAVTVSATPTPIPLPQAMSTFSGVGQNISALGNSLTIYENAVAKSLNIASTTNSKAGAGCTPMMVIFARGTTEPGTVGVLAGPPFFDALSAKVGAGMMSVQGVVYPADIPGFLAGGDKAGSATMAQMVTSAISTCPDSKIVMAGYSQGGQLVHNAAKLMPASMAAKVDSVVIFGDPNNGAPVAGVSPAKTKVICHVGDDICLHGDLILTPHLTYSMNAGEAASFVAGVAGM